MQELREDALDAQDQGADYRQTQEPCFLWTDKPKVTVVVVDGNAAKEFIEDNDETQDLEMPIYYVGLDIVKPHLISCTLGKYIPYYWHLLVILWPLGYKVGNFYQVSPCSQMSQL